MTTEEAKYLKRGDLVRFKSKPWDFPGKVVEATPWRVTIQWQDHIAPIDYDPRDMTDIHRRKRDKTHA